MLNRLWECYDLIRQTIKSALSGRINIASYAKVSLIFHQTKIVHP